MCYIFVSTKTIKNKNYELFRFCSNNRKVRN